MSLFRESSQGGWNSRWTFVAVTTGAAVGLGNLWKFSSLAGEHGGGAFIVIYLLCVALVSLPVLIAEVVIGSRGRANPIQSTLTLAREAHVSSAWQIIGWLGCLAGLLILSYYSVMAGIGLSYIKPLFMGEFTDLTAFDVGERFTELLANPQRLIYWHSIFVLLVMFLVSVGVKRGLALTARFVVPLLVLLLLALVLYSCRYGECVKAFDFLFVVRWQEIDADVVLAALGQAFFTLSIGLGAMMAFGAYMPDGRSIAGLLSVVVIIDTVVALLAGMAIFPLVFSQNIEPSMGPGLMYVALPYAFGNMETGALFGAVFFIVASLVALSSGIALLEPAVMWMVERFALRRFFAVLTIGSLVWALGVMALLSFNLWSELRWLGMTVFGWLDYLASNVILPIGGWLIAVFVGWRMREVVVRDEFYRQSGWVFVLWYWILRYIAAPAVLVILLAPVYREWVMA